MYPDINIVNPKTNKIANKEKPMFSTSCEYKGKYVSNYNGGYIYETEIDFSKIEGCIEYCIEKRREYITEKWNRHRKETFFVEYIFSNFNVTIIKETDKTIMYCNDRYMRNCTISDIYDVNQVLCELLTSTISNHTTDYRYYNYIINRQSFDYSQYTIIPLYHFLSSEYVLEHNNEKFFLCDIRTSCDYTIELYVRNVNNHTKEIILEISPIEILTNLKIYTTPKELGLPLVIQLCQLRNQLKFIE